MRNIIMIIILLFSGVNLIGLYGQNELLKLANRISEHSEQVIEFNNIQDSLYGQLDALSTYFNLEYKFDHIHELSGLNSKVDRLRYIRTIPFWNINDIRFSKLARELYVNSTKMFIDMAELEQLYSMKIVPAYRSKLYPNLKREILKHGGVWDRGPIPPYAVSGVPLATVYPPPSDGSEVRDSLLAQLKHDLSHSCLSETNQKLILGIVVEPNGDVGPYYLRSSDLKTLISEDDVLFECVKKFLEQLEFNLGALSIPLEKRSARNARPSRVQYNLILGRN